MKKVFAVFSALLLCGMAGCSAADGAGADPTMIYGAAAVLSLFLLVGYCCIERKRSPWFLLLFSSVLVVNIGYFALSVSQGLEQALFANRIAYLGSVFLPLSMLMIILGVTGIEYKRRLPALLLCVAAIVFFIAASPGYLDIYYKEVYFVTSGGVSSLRKVYGPLHSLYAVYLVLYFASMVTVIAYAALKKKMESTGHAVILAIAVFANLGVWFIEQLVHFEFEFLAVSYIISELFLLGLHLVIAENRRLKELVAEKESALIAAAETVPAAAMMAQHDSVAQFTDDRFARFLDGVNELTHTERAIFNAYIARVTTKEIMATLNIKENTLKFHNKNIYHKLGVSSRKELQEIYKQLHRAEDANVTL